MQETINSLSLNLSGKNMRSTIAELFTTKLLENYLPVSIELDYVETEITKDWIGDYLEKTQSQLKIKWENASNQQLRFYPGEEERIWIHIEKKIALREIITFMEAVQFSLASFSNLYEEWAEIDPDYIAPSFGNGHYPHGWACAFKGVGHNQMVSLRWLEHGPWKLIKGDSDLSFIQFHDLAATPEAALQQAKPGHNMIGISDEGGFIQDRYLFEFPIKGFYDAKPKLLKIIVHGQTLKPKQLLDYSAARLYQALGADKPLERIGIVFMEEEQAKKHLNILWLRDIECYAIVGGNEIRLDQTYEPLIQKPSWAL